MTVMRAQQDCAGQRKRMFWPAVTRFVADYAAAAGTLLVFVLAWQVVTGVWRIVPSYLLPAPTEVLTTLISRGPRLLVHAQATLTEIVVGYLIAVGLGFACAILLLYSRLVERIVLPLILFLQVIPKLSIAPLMIVWFGYSITPKVLMTALIAVFPILINTLLGLRSLDPQIGDLFHVLSAGERQIFFKGRLPNAWPHIFAGLKVGITFAAVGAVVSEWVGADAGLGFLILSNIGSGRLDFLFAVIVVIAALGIGLFAIIGILEMLVSPYHTRRAQPGERSPS